MALQRLSPLFTLLCAFAAMMAVTPLASAQGEDTLCSPWTLCLAVIAIFVVITLLGYMRAKREAERADQRGQGSGQTTPVEPVPRGYEQTPSFGTTPYSTNAPEPQYVPGYPGAPPVPGTPEDFTPVRLVREASQPKKGSATGACPRCGSTDIVNFETGEHKCNNCKKIFMD